MPYINAEKRERLAPNLDYLGIESPQDSGELNYLITYICHDYLNAWGKDYEHMNDVIGALEGAKLEFYRRVAAPYEDKKIEENGDVY